MFKKFFKWIKSIVIFENTNEVKQFITSSIYSTGFTDNNTKRRIMAFTISYYILAWVGNIAGCLIPASCMWIIPTSYILITMWAFH